MNLHWQRIDVRVRLIAARLRDAQRMNSRSKEVYADQLDSIAAAVAELIEAANGLDGFAMFDDREFDTDGFRAAKRRMAAALARIGGAP